MIRARKDQSTMAKRDSYTRREALRTSTRAAGLTAGWATVSTAGIALGAQDDKPKPAATVAAKPEDVRSIDAILRALYGTISGPPGRRDMDRLRSLFHPGARLIPCRGARDNEEKGTSAMRVLSVEEFITAIEPRVKVEGFFEQEVAQRIERFGSVAHVFSTYESRHAENDPQPFTRGINSIQLFFDGKRWWVVTIFWDSERPGQQIPAEYLPKQE
jgi:hypothetical protein